LVFICELKSFLAITVDCQIAPLFSGVVKLDRVGYVR
jgi:hypothetical protein